MASLLQQIVSSLELHHSDDNRRRWAKRIVNENISLEPLLSILQMKDGKAAMRFVWVLGGVVELSPEHISPVLPKLFAIRQSVHFPNYSRSLAKFFWLCGVPKKIEGEAIDALFQWLRNPDEQVSVKVYSIYALLRACERHPDLRHELVLSLEMTTQPDQPSFRFAVKKARAALLKMGQK